ncbi:polysaccharide biosynthesis/export family protein [Paraburkholderia dinghuensis]|nr:polysaccharide biosynthesis/export family protein [Paraburkholderia dinghuensis]
MNMTMSGVYLKTAMAPAARALCYVMPGVAAMAAAALLAACSSVAPGMRMDTPPTLPTGETAPGAAGGENAAAQGQQEIPVTEITLKLIRDLNTTPGPDQIYTELQSGTKPGPYTLGPGDVVDITVWDHPELIQSQGQANAPAVSHPSDPAPGFVVDQDGFLQFPYIGREHVAGITIEDVQRIVYRKLAEYYTNPQVTVRIVSYRAKQVFVDGEVTTPGALAITDVPMTLYQAITRAGGFTKNADQSQVVLVREGKSYRLNLPDMLARGENPSSIRLRNGDMLRIVAREEHGVYVMGEVSKPVTAVPLRNGKLNLSDAISQAGSISRDTASPRQLYVIRGSTTAKPEVFHLDAGSPVSMILANQFPLQPEDVVYVDSNGLVRLSRVLNLLLPGINAALTAAVLSK